MNFIRVHVYQYVPVLYIDVKLYALFVHIAH